jgi:rubredoxin
MSDSQTIALKKKLVDEYAARPQTDVPQQREKYPSDTVPLATKGWFYPEGHPLSSGDIELKQVTAREEDILANQELIKKGKVLDKLMEAIIVNKSIRIEEILVPDQNSIFIAIRRLAYGDEYNVEVTCPSCNKKEKATFDLSNVKYKEINFEQFPKGQNNFSFTLPSGINVTYKLLNKQDEDAIETELNQLKKISKDGSNDVTTRLKHVLTSIDGNTDRSAIRKFIDEKLTAKDSLALRRHMKETNPNIDVSFDFTCPSCGLERKLDMPLGASFLWPDIDA